MFGMKQFSNATSLRRRSLAAEEAANAVTHGVGAALGAAALVFLVLAARPAGAVAIGAAAVFGAMLLLVYLSSALHHGLRHPPAKRLFLLLDRCAIYLLIAGTYTPLSLLALPLPLGPRLLAAIWLLAAFGVAIELVGHRRAGRRRGLAWFDWLPVVLYLVMGWLGLIVAGGTIATALRPAALDWLIAGGVIYTIGVAFYLWRRLPYGHAVWHVFAVAGSACHVWMILGHVLPAA